MAFENIPDELKYYDNWVVWKLEERDGKQTKIPYNPNNGHKADPTDKTTWGSFQQCVNLFNTYAEISGIGFVLSHEDPFAFIDLDDVDKSMDIDAAIHKQGEIYRDFPSYAEKSPSGKGLHIIVKGSIPNGRRNSKYGIEVYSSDRYMTMTGEVYRNLPIVDCNTQLNALYAQLTKPVTATQIYMGLGEEEFTDEQVCEMAYAAVNGQKFYDLYTGDWEQYYGSQSEADFALINIIAFYSKNRAQIARIFRASALGQRDKAQRDSFVGNMINRSFDQMLPEVDVSALQQKIEEEIKSQATAIVKTDSTSTEYEIEVPPGLIGDIAAFIYEQSPRPVKEISLTAALGLMSGICGRAYNISGLGLNQYILTLGMTGVGKEAAASGIDKLMTEVVKVVPHANTFVGPAEISSSQALRKHMSGTSNCFVSIVGEFGLYLQQMASQKAPPHLHSLKRTMLDLYNKTGGSRTLRGTIYSDTDKNVDDTISPSFSLIGESTPETFYAGLNESLIADGLLPRFSVIEYKGKRNHRNKQAHLVKPSFQLIDNLAKLCAQSLNLNNQHKPQTVGITPDAEAFFDSFDIQCDNLINSGESDVPRQLWSRAYVKAIKLAALVAIGINYINPVVTIEAAQWAVSLVTHEVKSILSKFSNGEVGSDNDEVKQIEKIQLVIRDYIVSEWNDVSKHLTDSFRGLHASKIVPYAYVQKRCASLQLFKNDKMGSSNSIKRALKTMCERGDIQEMSKGTLSREFNSSAVCYAVLNPKLLSKS